VSEVLPFSSLVDYAIAKQRELEAHFPFLEKFDETKLPPRAFELKTEEESAWTHASLAILHAFAAKTFAELEAIEKGWKLSVACDVPAADA
jgi:hypothetical protein